MATEYRYQLAKRGKWVCPQCQHKTFVLYVDTDGQPLNESVGKCDRLDNCNYHYTPREYFADNGISAEQKPKKPTIRPIIRPRPSYIDTDIFKASLKRYENNRFVSFLHGLFDGDPCDVVRQLVSEYYIGTSSHWDGATVFWQVDRYGHIHGGKIMLYDAATGKRVKQPFNHITWVHSALKLDNFNLNQCLFGEHLLNVPAYSNYTVCIVESEKTAILGTGFAADAVWLACGGCQNLSKKVCQPLTGRRVVLMPDNGKYDDWAARGRELKGVCKDVFISDIMEQKAAEKGDDIGDLLIARHRAGTLDESIFDGTNFKRL